MREEYLLTGSLEPTNEPYAVAKIAGIKLCSAYAAQYAVNFFSLMPTNLYGPNDTFNLESSHVLPALMQKIHDAKVHGRSCVEIWGTGEPRREFLHSDDLADACVFLLEKYTANEIGEFVNVGSGEDIRIIDLAALIAEVVGYVGEFSFNPEMPDGPPRKLLDCSRICRLGWRPRIALRDGIAETYRSFLEGKRNR
jgi:GDP-L-fucose synthase